MTVLAPEVGITRPSRTRRRSARGVILMLLCLLGLIGVACAGVVARYHTAAVTLHPAEQSFSRVVPFAVSVVPTNDANAIQAAPYETTLVRETDVQGTGSVMVPDGAASGVMTFRSRADTATTLRAGTSLKGPRDVAYILQSDVTVPALDFIRGQLGQATAQVRASAPGPTGNLTAGFVSQYSQNITYISGEIAGGTEKAAPVVTDDDVATIRGQLEANIRAHALADVNASLPAGTTAINDKLVLQPAVASSQPASGTQAASAHVKISVVARIPIYKNADFDALINRRLDETVRETSEQAAGSARVVPASIEKSKPVFVEVQGSLVRYFATVNGRLQAIITDGDRERLRHALVGKDSGRAGRLLAAEPKVGAYETHYGRAWLPRLLREHMPWFEANLHVDVA